MISFWSQNFTVKPTTVLTYQLKYAIYSTSGLSERGEQPVSTQNQTKNLWPEGKAKTANYSTRSDSSILYAVKYFTFLIFNGRYKFKPLVSQMCIWCIGVGTDNIQEQRTTHGITLTLFQNQTKNIVQSKQNQQSVLFRFLW